MRGYGFRLLGGKERMDHYLGSGSSSSRHHDMETALWLEARKHSETTTCGFSACLCFLVATLIHEQLDFINCSLIPFLREVSFTRLDCFAFFSCGYKTWMNGDVSFPLPRCLKPSLMSFLWARLTAKLLHQQVRQQLQSGRLGMHATAGVNGSREKTVGVGNWKSMSSPYWSCMMWCMVQTSGAWRAGRAFDWNQYHVLDIYIPRPANMRCNFFPSILIPISLQCYMSQSLVSHSLRPSWHWVPHALRPCGMMWIGFDWQGWINASRVEWKACSQAGKTWNMTKPTLSKSVGWR